MEPLLPHITGVADVEARICEAAANYLRPRSEGASAEEITTHIRKTDRQLYEQLRIINALREHDEALAAQSPTPERRGRPKGSKNRPKDT
jgi:hypothetical protein